MQPAHRSPLSPLTMSHSVAGCLLNAPDKHPNIFYNCMCMFVFRILCFVLCDLLLCVGCVLLLCVLKAQCQPPWRCHWCNSWLVRPLLLYVYVCMCFVCVYVLCVCVCALCVRMCVCCVFCYCVCSKLNATVTGAHQLVIPLLLPLASCLYSCLRHFVHNPSGQQSKPLTAGTRANES